MAKIELKQPIVKEIAELLDGAQAAVVVDYRGLSAEQDTKLRKELREAGVTYKVYKNTMIRIAAKGTPFESLDSSLATAPARILYNFSKTAPDLELKAGVVDGVTYDQDGIKVIATVPSRDELIGRLLGSIQSPITNLARVLNQIAESKEAEA